MGHIISHASRYNIRTCTHYMLYVMESGYGEKLCLKLAYIDVISFDLVFWFRDFCKSLQSIFKLDTKTYTTHSMSFTYTHRNTHTYIYTLFSIMFCCLLFMSCLTALLFFFLSFYKQFCFFFFFPISYSFSITPKTKNNNNNKKKSERNRVRARV